MSDGVDRASPLRAVRPVGVPAWSEVAEDWLAAKRVGRRRDDPGHADRARRGDLRRWAGAINTVQGRRVPWDPPHSLAGWDFVMTELGDVDVLVRALDLLGDDLASSSRQRALSTLRGFCGYLVRRGLFRRTRATLPSWRCAARPASSPPPTSPPCSPRRPLPHHRTYDPPGRSVTQRSSRSWRTADHG